jgi:hypothetical protein
MPNRHHLRHPLPERGHEEEEGIAGVAYLAQQGAPIAAVVRFTGEASSRLTPPDALSRTVNPERG